MKTVKSITALRRLALARGAEIVAPGERFNSSRIRAVPAPEAPEPEEAPSPAPTPEQTPPAPILAPPQGLTREEVERMLAVHNERVGAQLQVVLAELRAARTVQGQQEPRQWDFQVTYDADHAITNVTAKAKP